MLDLEVLVLELLAEDGLATHAVAHCKVTALDHEIGDDAVEGASLVAEFFAGISNALIAEAEMEEILNCPRNNLTIKAHQNTTSLDAIDFNVEIYLMSHLRLAERNRKK